MDELKNLIEKYFRAETTLEEEKLLNDYFAGDAIDPEFEPYRALFGYFNEEKSLKYNSKVQNKSVSGRRIWFQIATFSGIAAGLALLFTVVKPQQTTDYAIIKGKRIENIAYVQHFAENKLLKMNTIMNRSMKPLKSVDEVRSGMKQFEKIDITREKLNEIHKLLIIK
jgi:hypothetical protein